MSLHYCSLNSGSNANCYYIGNHREAVLIDAGLACRKVEHRLKRLGLDISKIKGIFISHEHADHITGAAVLSKKHQIPVYITPTTLVQSGLILHPHLTFEFRKYRPISVGSLSIMAFPKKHDASNPHSFIVTQEGISIGVFTDIGTPCRHVKKFFNQCQVAFLEANYDEDMLQTGPYPFSLKQRVCSDEGHLSNLQALELFMYHKSNDLSHLILSHISQNNNSPQIVEDLFYPVAKNIRITIASRKSESALFQFDARSSKVSPPVGFSQLSLFN